MARIFRLLVWLRRCRYSRGFGVQSPWAYRLVRYVINEHYPYYAYEELSAFSSQYGKRQQKLARLYFRLSNYLQADGWYMYATLPDPYTRYITRGCQKCSVHQLTASEDIEGSVRVASVDMDGDYSSVCERLLESMRSDSLLVLEGIHRNMRNLAYWRQLVRDERVGVTFDLYYCGLVFFDKKLYKRNYIINF